SLMLFAFSQQPCIASAFFALMMPCFFSASSSDTIFAMSALQVTASPAPAAADALGAAVAAAVAVAAAAAVGAALPGPLFAVDVGVAPVAAGGGASLFSQPAMHAVVAKNAVATIQVLLILSLLLRSLFGRRSRPSAARARAGRGPSWSKGAGG